MIGQRVWKACIMHHILPVPGVVMRGYKGGPAPLSFSLHPHLPPTFLFYFPRTFHLAPLLSF